MSGYFLLKRYACFKIKSKQTGDNELVDVTGDGTSHQEHNYVNCSCPNVGEEEVTNPMYTLHPKSAAPEADSVYSEVRIGTGWALSTATLPG